MHAMLETNTCSGTLFSALGPLAKSNLVLVHLHSAEMQTKKKPSGRNGSHEGVSPRISRAQRKVSESGQEVEKNVTDLITSSNRKKKPSKLLVTSLFLFSFSK